VLSQPQVNGFARLTAVSTFPKKDQSLTDLMKSVNVTKGLQIPSVPGERLAAVTTYKVHIQNNLSQIVDEVVLFFKRNSDPVDAPVHAEHMTNVLPGQTRYFDLGSC
jgi:hypothetical protein